MPKRLQIGAAILIKEKELDNRFEDSFNELFSDDTKRTALGTAIKTLALPGATAAIVDEVEKILQESEFKG